MSIYDGLTRHLELSCPRNCADEQQRHVSKYTGTLQSRSLNNRIYMYTYRIYLLTYRSISIYTNV